MSLLNGRIDKWTYSKPISGTIPIQYPASFHAYSYPIPFHKKEIHMEERKQEKKHIETSNTSGQFYESIE